MKGKRAHSFILERYGEAGRQGWGLLGKPIRIAAVLLLALAASASHGIAQYCVNGRTCQKPKFWPFIGSFCWPTQHGNCNCEMYEGVCTCLGNEFCDYIIVTG